MSKRSENRHYCGWRGSGYSDSSAPGLGRIFRMARRRLGHDGTGLGHDGTRDDGWIRLGMVAVIGDCVLGAHYLGNRGRGSRCEQSKVR